MPRQQTPHTAHRTPHTAHMCTQHTATSSRVFSTQQYSHTETRAQTKLCLIIDRCGRKARSQPASQPGRQLSKQAARPSRAHHLSGQFSFGRCFRSFASCRRAAAGHALPSRTHCSWHPPHYCMGSGAPSKPPFQQASLPAFPASSKAAKLSDAGRKEGMDE